MKYPALGLLVRTISVLAISLNAPIGQAALSPRYQNEKDLKVLVQFINEHERILSTLKTIDLEHLIIHFGHDCKAVFGRKSRAKPKWWVGPVDPLEFKESTCNLKH